MAITKITKYALLTQSYSFIPVAAETMGAINSNGIEFMGELGRRITRITDDNTLQPLSVSDKSAEVGRIILPLVIHGIRFQWQTT